MKANYEDKIKPQAEISLGNLYEMNKQLMMQEETMTDGALDEALGKLKIWIEENYKEKYLMLLCHERRDYTLFNLDKTSSWKIAPAAVISDAALDVVECLTNRGNLLSLEEQLDGAWEAWVRIYDECFAYYLFPYGAAVLEY